MRRDAVVGHVMFANRRSVAPRAAGMRSAVSSWGSGMDRLVMGGVASHVVTHAPCSVLVVKQQKSDGKTE